MLAAALGIVPGKVGKIMKTNRAWLRLGLGMLLLSGSSTGWSDEGMWLFNAPPRALLKERHNFEVTDAWLEHVQKSSVRFNSGGSGEVVSEDGLIMSNHHVGADALQKISTKENDYLKDGFHARTLAEEKPKT
jgi:S1-C subfamily serine protease